MIALTTLATALALRTFYRYYFSMNDGHLYSYQMQGRERLPTISVERGEPLGGLTVGDATFSAETHEPLKPKTVEQPNCCFRKPGESEKIEFPAHITWEGIELALAG